MTLTRGGSVGLPRTTPPRRAPAGPLISDDAADPVEEQLLILSGHDFRSPRKAGIHFVAEAAASRFRRRRFISIGYSPLSEWFGDARRTLGVRANVWQAHEGVDCLLWKTPFHPFNVPVRPINALNGAVYRAFAHWPSRQFDEAVATSSVILLESGLSPVFLKRIAASAPNARLIYYCSDLLETIGVHAFVQRRLRRNLDLFSTIRIPSPLMEARFELAGPAVRLLPNGLPYGELDRPMQSPYGGRPAICSVGSMLFDPAYIEVAAAAFPDVAFHVIGSGLPVVARPNVRVHPEMAYRETLPYLRFASVVAAPYREAHASAYLADTSLKLLQAGYYGVPAVCPDFAAGDVPARFGYRAGDPDAMIAATAGALAAGAQAPLRTSPSWRAIADALFA